MLVFAQNNSIVPIPGTNYHGLAWCVERIVKAGVPGWAVRDGLRTKDQQWVAWVKYQNGGPAADDPTRPWLYRLPHVRGIAFDIDPLFNDQMHAAGFWRPFYDPVNPNTGVPQWRRDEPWHYEPVGINIYDYPLVEAIPAGGGSTPFEPKEWDEMASKEEIADAVRGVVKAAVREEILAQSNNLAGGVLNYGPMESGKSVGGVFLPKETLAERIRQIRRSTYNINAPIRSMKVWLPELLEAVGATQEQIARVQESLDKALAEDVP